MANTIFTSWKSIQLGSTLSSTYTGGPINFLTADIYIALFTTSWTPNAATDQFYSDISAYEVSNTGNYTAGGAALSGKGITNDTANSRGLFDASTNPSWSSVTFSPRYAALYYNASTGEKPLICAYDFGSAQTASNGTFTVTFSSSPAAAFGIG